VAFRRPFLATVLSLAFGGVASAQGLLTTPAERVAHVREAFDSAYGKALTAELGKALRRDADPGCLQAKGLQDSQLEKLGRDLLLKWGIRFSEGAIAFFDTKAYAERFSGADEFKRLEQNADVKEYLAIAAPARQATLLDHIIENFRRYVLISRIKLTFAPPLETGNAELVAKNPTEAIEDALDKFVADRKSAALDLYLDLSDESTAALKASIDKGRVLTTSPHNLFEGVETDLADICIGRRP